MRLTIQYSRIQTYFAEFACSFLFGFVVYSAILVTTLLEIEAAPILIGLAIALVSVAIIWCFMDVTIAHFNPAITFAAVVFCKIPIIKGILYIISQGLGFMLAAVVVLGCFPGGWREIMDIIRPKPASDAVTGEVICIELFLTGILVFTVFCAAANTYKDQVDARNQRDLRIDPQDSKIPNRKMYVPIMIGFTLGYLGLLGGATSGGAFNPGIVWAPVLLGARWRDSWKYWVGEFVGAFAAGLIQTILFYPFY